MICKNCDTKYEGNYCHSCGQSSTVRRFVWHHLLNQIIQTIGYDRGLFYTIFL